MTEGRVVTRSRSNSRFDALKARTKGYASLDYELEGYEKSDLVKVDLLLNGSQVDDVPNR